MFSIKKARTMPQKIRQFYTSVALQFMSVVLWRKKPEMIKNLSNCRNLKNQNCSTTSIQESPLYKSLDLIWCALLLERKKQQKKINQKKQQWKQKRKWFIGLAIRGINKTLLVYSALGFELFNFGLRTQDFNELRFHTLLSGAK